MSIKNIDKILQYAVMVAKNPIIVDGESYFRPKNCIKLQKSFFLKDGCNFCGGCDVAEDNVYTPEEYQRILSCPKDEFDFWGLDYEDLSVLKSKLREETHDVNGRQIVLYTYKLEPNNLFLPTRDRVIPRCTWSKEFEPGVFKCRIHPVVSLTCDMPHLRFSYVARTATVSLGIQQFGRNWALKCPVVFEEPQDEFQFIEARDSRIRKLKRLDAVCNEFGAETWIPEMLEYINKIPYDRYQDFLQKTCVVTRKKYFGLHVN